MRDRGSMVVVAGLMAGAALACSVERHGLHNARRGSDGGSADAARDGGEHDPGSDSGTCAGPCSPGQTESETRNCGRCGEQERGRTCTVTCAWGPWSDWGECTGETGSCTPGDEETVTSSCGRCDNGVRETTRTCAETCTWGSPEEGSCEGATSCRDPSGGHVCPGETAVLDCEPGTLVCTCQSDGSFGMCSGTCAGRG